jgi:C4-dicarboxylate-specific signal transduction histidine kinase
MAFLSTAAGGYFYYTSLKKATTAEVEIQAASHAKMLKNLFAHHMQNSIKAVKGLAGHKEIKRALANPHKIAIDGANLILDNFNAAFEASVSYLMNREGSTVASSNRNDPLTL